MKIVPMEMVYHQAQEGLLLILIKISRLWGSRFYELTEEIEKVAFQLYEERLVEFSNKSIYGKRKLEFVNNEKNIEKIYHELQRKSLKEKKKIFVVFRKI